MATERDLLIISADPISQEKVTSFVTDRSAGGISLFIGNCSFITLPPHLHGRPSLYFYLLTGSFCSYTYSPRRAKYIFHSLIVVLFSGTTRDNFQGNVHVQTQCACMCILSVHEHSLCPSQARR